LVAALSRAKAIGIIDRDYSFGSPFGSGVVANEIRAALYNSDRRPPLVSFICGLGGREVTLEEVYKAADMCYAAAASGKSDAEDPLAGRGERGRSPWPGGRRSRTRRKFSSRFAASSGSRSRSTSRPGTGPARAASRRWS